MEDGLFRFPFKKFNRLRVKLKQSINIYITNKIEHSCCLSTYTNYIDSYIYLSSRDKSTPWLGGAVRFALINGPKFFNIIFNDSHAIITYLMKENKKREV